MTHLASFFSLLHSIYLFVYLACHIFPLRHVFKIEDGMRKRKEVTNAAIPVDVICSLRHQKGMTIHL